METFSMLLAICEGNSPVTGEFPSQRPVMFSLFYTLTTGWVNHQDACDLWYPHTHYDVTNGQEHELNQWWPSMQLHICVNTYRPQWVMWIFSVNYGNNIITFYRIYDLTADMVVINRYQQPCYWLCLTHWGWDEMNNIWQMTFSNVFSWMKMFEFRLKIHWSLFPRIQ